MNVSNFFAFIRHKLRPASFIMPTESGYSILRMCLLSALNVHISKTGEGKDLQHDV